MIHGYLKPYSFNHENLTVMGNSLDCGADHRLAQPVQAAGKRLEVSEPKRARLPSLLVSHADG